MNVLDQIEVEVYKSRYDEYALYESSLSRIWQHAQRGYFTISAFRDEYGLEENLKRHKSLKNDVRSANLGFFEIDGSYVYDNGDISSELSLFIPYTDIYSVEEFRDVAIRLGKKYNQESILLFLPEVGGWFYYMDGRKEKVGDITSLDKFKKFFSALRKGSHKGRRFVVEGHRIPSSIMATQMLFNEGMIILNKAKMRRNKNKEFGVE